jgi:putative intracellular protease/amidase
VVVSSSRQTHPSDDAPRFDILWIPGGDPAALAEWMEDKAFLAHWSFTPIVSSAHDHE